MKRALARLRCFRALRLTLLHLSWVSLAVGDASPALSWASQLLSMDACPPSLKLYAHLYACDALVQLSRSSEALEHLTAALESNEPLVTVASCTGAEPPAAADGEGLDCVRNPYSLLLGASAGGGQAAARATLYANLAVVHALRGDRAQASDFAQQALRAQPALLEQHLGV